MNPSLSTFAKIMTVLAVITVSSIAYASPYEMYGAGIQESAMGTSLTHASDYGAAYYNAALLPEVGSTFSFGSMITYSTAAIKLKQRPKGYDIPDGSDSTPLPTSKQLHQRVDTDGPAPIYALTLGTTHNLGIKNLGIGAAIFVPLNTMFRMSTHFSDERERYFRNQLTWELIDQRVSRLDVEVGVGYRILDWLSFGVSASFLPGAIAAMETYVPQPTDQSHILLSSNVAPTTAWAIAGGLLFQLPLNLRLAFTGRTSLSFDVKGQNRLQVRGVSEKGDVSQEIKWRPIYSPPFVAMALAWDAPDDVLVELSFRYTRWDDYLDTVYEKTDFSNVLETSLGLKYTPSPLTSFMVGATFTPTPIPNQTGRTNYVDNSRFRFSIGGTHRISIIDYPFEIGWAAQFFLLLPHETTKKSSKTYPGCDKQQVTSVCDEVPDGKIDSSTGKVIKNSRGLQTGNPGFPGWTSGGLIAGLHLEVRL